MKKSDYYLILKKYDDFIIKTILINNNSYSAMATKLFGDSSSNARNVIKELLSKYCIDFSGYNPSEKKNFCKNCGKEITGKDRLIKKFCNCSCAASYNNRGICRNGTKKDGLNYCLYCKKEIPVGHKYCGIQCETAYHYKKYIDQWKNGEKSGTIGKDDISKHVVKYMFEKYNNSCQECGWSVINKYTNKVPLQIHHIDGDCTNNKEENLQLLCPNCHALTENFGSRNKNSKRKDKRLR